MHQYFIDKNVEIGDIYVFSKEQAHHVKNVLHMSNDLVRLVYNGQGYFGHVMYEDGKPCVKIEEMDTRYNELNLDITLCIALIRKEKFELILQKATELGVKKIVPFVSSRCVVQPKKEKQDKQLARYQSILLEASEQCKRNCVPEITNTVSFDELLKMEADCKVACYENAYHESTFLTDSLDENTRSILVTIGPEGGFSEQEMKKFAENNYTSITLGSRILRAETAAIYVMSVLSECAEVKK